MEQQSTKVTARVPVLDSGTSAQVPGSRFGDLRVGPILALPAVLAELGVSPGRAFAQAHVDPGLFEDPAARIATEPLGRLFRTHRV
jgi:hypothetical protein